MQPYERIAEERAQRSRPGPAGSRAHAGSAAALLRLQRMAGNAATSRLVRARRKTDAEEDARTALASADPGSFR